MTMNSASRDSNAEVFFPDPLPGQERFVAPLDQTPLKDVDSINEAVPATSMWADAWKTLRRNPIFIISAVLVIFVLLVALFPALFTKQSPVSCNLQNSLEGGGSGHPFGYDLQGCDVYSRVIYGARTSVSIGVATTILVTIMGGLVGAIAGFCGGWVDAVLSRVTDIFFAIPMLLGAIVLLQMFRTSTSIWKIVFTLTLFGWVNMARITRSAVLEAKNLEFNTASTALGSSPIRNLFRHIIPNSLAPVIVMATMSLGSYIVSEATLSFLGIGLPSSVVSWGGDISTAQNLLRTNPSVLFYPSAALAITVLAFIMMGDAVKDALDPKSRTA
ncbi:oligopeptide ABC superfamily ATP binding cassette OppC [Bifidobacterium actinocoloniiforme DSM 22766]|uniref:Oligopeptide ABC superfamily ATP binding cassette OppC n=1 Tax=Bifidobacterium actinocoloniiforme DSM 22766 TaxID=1437605 RepID=A0A086Z0V8_9BIFI|nr:ABC transporter permease [Bifidobacterium actinocoloniiforme]AKV55349.1 peptide ABC transporter permease [Bifidobacterium actinocoloniiforme DSM 22766]KFI40158.1 oligopeptide ABC superfamily ATP binding cassette OppC [Bifidobacterium actinocoloniiforme DSM 22766]